MHLFFKYFFANIFIVAFFVSCANKQSTIITEAKTETTASTDSSTLMQLIEKETQNFYKKDYTNWSTCFVHTNTLHWICVEPDISLRAKGWEDLSKFVQDWMQSNPKPMDYVQSKFTLQNIKMQLSPTMAFVNYESSNLNEDGKTMRYTLESRTLIKEAKDWKILSMCSYPNDTPTGSSANIYKHTAQ
jgi:hypothetical protein